MAETEHRRRMTEPADAAGVAVLVLHGLPIPDNPMEVVVLGSTTVEL